MAEQNIDDKENKAIETDKEIILEVKDVKSGSQTRLRVKSILRPLTACLFRFVKAKPSAW